jgi:hypothetical protein
VDAGRKFVEGEIACRQRKKLDTKPSQSELKERKVREDVWGRGENSREIKKTI